MRLNIILRYLPLIVIFTLGTILRLYNFNTIPFGLHHDGALEGLEAIELSKTPLPYRPYSQLGWQGESLFRYCLAFLIHFLGPSVWVIKLGSTLFSIFTLFSFYLFANELFGKRMAVFSLFFLAVSGWHIVMGKTVWRAITLPFFETLFFYYLLRFLKHRSTISALLSGVLLALTLNTYNASRIVPAFAVFAGILFLYLERPKINIRKVLPKILFLALSFFILILPLLSYSIKNKSNFNSRAQYLFVGNKIKEMHSFQPLFDNIKKTALMFNVKAGGDDFFVNEPLLDGPVSLFFLIGILYCLYYCRKFSNSFLLTGFLFSLIPGLITVPNGNRNIGVLPFVYIFAGIGVYFIYKQIIKLNNGHIYASTFLFLVFSSSILITYNIYFGSERREIFGFYPEATIVGNYIKQNIENGEFYLIDNFPRDTLTFLTYLGGNPYEKHYTWFDNPDNFYGVKLSLNKTTNFIMMPGLYNSRVLKNLEKRYANGRQFELYYYFNNTKRPVAWVFNVPPFEILEK